MYRSIYSSVTVVHCNSFIGYLKCSFCNVKREANSVERSPMRLCKLVHLANYSEETIFGTNTLLFYYEKSEETYHGLS